ncbi:MAG: hypothetical protein WA814_08940 [Candidatus Baltobacteraceae bacterium]
MKTSLHAAARITAVALLAAVTPAQAQSLQRLTVGTFALSADPSRPQVDQPFHLIVTLRVREPVARIDNLELPVLAELELLGDERQIVSGPRGTEYREVVTVAAHRTGALTIGPARLQAIDARDNKPKEWATNGLRLDVAGAAPQLVGADALNHLGAAVLLLLRILLWLFGIAAIVVLALLLFRRRAPTPVPVAPAPAPQPSPPVPVARSQRQQLEDALAVLRAEHTRAAAIRVRAAVWRMVGANDGETLADVLKRPESDDVTLRGLLVALERSAFTYDDDLAAAIDGACAALQRRIEALA